MNQLLDRWLEMVELERTTRAGYVGTTEKHIRPTIGKVEVGNLDAETKNYRRPEVQSSVGYPAVSAVAARRRLWYARGSADGEQFGEVGDGVVAGGAGGEGHGDGSS